MTVYPRQPILGRAGVAGETRDWRVDAIDLPPLEPGDPVAPRPLLEQFAREFADRNERPVPIETLVRFDLQRGLDDAVGAARQ